MALCLARVGALEAQVSAIMMALTTGALGRPVQAPAPDLGPAMEQRPAADLVHSALPAMRTMTIKQRATTIAMMEGHSFEAIASAMGVDATTVKLHAKAAYGKLGVSGKQRLLEIASSVLPMVTSPTAVSDLGVPADWMGVRPPALMDQLRRVKMTSPSGGKGRSQAGNP